MNPLPIGSRLWHFDANRRTYPEGAGLGSAPVFSLHFAPFRVIGFQRRSYVVQAEGAGILSARVVGWRSVNVWRSAYDGGYFVTDAERDRLVWIEGHRADLSRAVLACEDVVKLKAAADALGFVTVPPKPAAGGAS